MMVQPVKANEKDHYLRQMLFYLGIAQKDMDDFLQRFGVKSVLSSYGMSETVVGLIGDRPSEKRKFPSIGRVGFCYEAKIVDKDGKKQLVLVNDGFLEVGEEKTTILATQAVAIGGDSESAVAKSLQRAKDMLASISSDAANSAAIMARVDEFARQS